MHNTASDLGSCDNLRKTWQVVSFWVLPAVVATIAIVLSDRRPALLLAAGAALVVMGGACLVNAARCRRLHCYITGPYFLVLALSALLAYWFAPNGEHLSRLWLLLALGATPLLIWLPERLARRKYLNAPVCGEDRECR
ncbi:hypothetical protein [Pseudomonas rhizophila]